MSADIENNSTGTCNSMYRSTSQVFYWIIHTKSGAALKLDRVVQQGVLRILHHRAHFVTVSYRARCIPAGVCNSLQWLSSLAAGPQGISFKPNGIRLKQSSPFVELFVRSVNSCHGQIRSCVVFPGACVNLCYTCIWCLYRLHVQMLPSLLASIQRCPDTSLGTIWPNRR